MVCKKVALRAKQTLAHRGRGTRVTIEQMQRVLARRSRPRTIAGVRLYNFDYNYIWGGQRETV